MNRKPVWAVWLAVCLAAALVCGVPIISMGQEAARAADMPAMASADPAPAVDPLQSTDVAQSTDPAQSADAVTAEDLVITRPLTREELGPFPDDPALALDYLIYRRYFEPKKHENKVVYLTLDDGPSHKTLEYLDILESKGVKATFFLLGKQVKKYPELALAIRERGHRLGNHTYTHVYKTVYQNVDVFMEEVEKTRAVILEAAGVDVRLVRAPGGVYGHFEKAYYRRLEAAGYVNHDWNLDSQDSVMKKVTAEKIMKHIRAANKDRQVIVLLIHDSGKAASLEALPQIIDYYLEEGYAFDVLPEYETVAVHNILPLREIKAEVEAALSSRE
jgi:peptidoglycan/xylan/chitin deacetylase (PgdA/CDA1 family)